MSEDNRRFICLVCGYIYDEAKGDPDSGLAPGTRFEDIPDDWYCPLCGVTKADFVPLEDAPAAAAEVPPATAGAGGGPDPDGVVVIGAGIAGWTAAEALRREQPERGITLVTADDGGVYPKPALSNSLAKGRTPEDLLETTGRDKAAELGVGLHAFTRVLGIDPHRQRVVTASGGLPYGDLVLATGARAVPPPLEGDGAGAIRTVNNLADYRRLRRELPAVRRVTVLGAGLVGTELAEDLNAGGYTVTLADPAPTPLAAFLPPVLGQRLTAALTANGITVRPATLAAEVTTTETGYRLQTTTGDHWHADLVVSATGLQPVLEPAHSAGLDVGRGIAVDRAMRTSDPHIFAVGDGAEVEGQCYAFIEPIQRQARAAAAAIAGRDAGFVPLPPLIRVKTPSLPLAICPPAPGRKGQWTEAESVGDDHLLLHHEGDTLTGFAACGPFTEHAGDLYRQLREAAQPVDAQALS